MLAIQTIGSSQKPAIIWLHGFLGSALDWLPAMETLSNQYYNIAIDLPGHGRSSHYRAQSIQHTGQLVCNAIDSVGITQYGMVGYSMGGRVARMCAQIDPIGCQFMILESTHPGLSTESEKNQRLTHDGHTAQIMRQDFNAFLTSWYDAPLWNDIQTHPQFNALMEQRLTADPYACADALEALSLGHQNRCELTVDYVNFVGEKDKKYMALFDEDNTKIVIPNAGHNTHFQNFNGFQIALKKKLNYHYKAD